MFNKEKYKYVYLNILMRDDGTIFIRDKKILIIKIKSMTNVLYCIVLLTDNDNNCPPVVSRSANVNVYIFIDFNFRFLEISEFQLSKTMSIILPKHSQVRKSVLECQ